jgi:hypothetical protein
MARIRRLCHRRVLKFLHLRILNSAGNELDSFFDVFSSRRATPGGFFMLKPENPRMPRPLSRTDYLRTGLQGSDSLIFISNIRWCFFAS